MLIGFLLGLTGFLTRFYCFFFSCGLQQSLVVSSGLWWSYPGDFWAALAQCSGPNNMGGAAGQCNRLWWSLMVSSELQGRTNCVVYLYTVHWPVSSFLLFSSSPNTFVPGFFFFFFSCQLKDLLSLILFSAWNLFRFSVIFFIRMMPWNGWIHYTFPHELEYFGFSHRHNVEREFGITLMFIA